MCGIVGYVGRRDALDVVLRGLGRLEYRGYDSAGVAVLTSAGVLAVARKAGALACLIDEIDATGRAALRGTVGMGHTRWATHGAPTDRNAHPHCDSAGRLAVVHNGIIENHAQLRAELERDGVELASDTDSETAAHLLAAAYARCGDLPMALRLVCRRLCGAFTLVVSHVDEPDLIVAARRSSPLVLGVGEREHFVASDVAAFIKHTRNAVELGQDQVVTIPGMATRSPISTVPPYAGDRFTSIGTSPRRRRAATTTSCSRRSRNNPAPSPIPCAGTSSTAGSCWMSSGWTPRSCVTSTRSS
jgi:glutamine---fructose-6-phosphate transaminase (isomerizing)